MAFNYLLEMLNVSAITLYSTAIILTLSIIYVFLKDRDLPPGPTGLPLLGYWPFLRHEGIHFQLTDFKKKYGDVYSMRVTGQLFIFLGSMKSIKEAQLTKADCFADRYTAFGSTTIIFDKGVSLANGDEWKVLRKFFIQSFREFGVLSVKDYLAGPIYDAVNASVEKLRAANGKPVNIVPIFNECSGNIFRRMVFNDNEITDQELNGVIDCYQTVTELFVGKNLLLMGQFARYFVFPTLKCYKTSIESRKKIHHYLSQLIRRHEKSYNEDNIRDIIDKYIKERNDRRKKGDPSAEYFSEDALISSLVQFVGDGILGIAYFIAFFIRGLLDYPEEQDKIHKELEEVIGSDRQITLEDRTKLPYTNAFMQEVMRTTDFFTYLPSLLCTKETTLNGYRIPKGAITVLNMWPAQRDPELFDEPDNFKPSRYVAEPGKPKTEAPILFGVGKRACSGESYTMMQVFLFLASVVRNFKLEYAEGEDSIRVFEEGKMNICAFPRK